MRVFLKMPPTFILSPKGRKHKSYWYMEKYYKRETEGDKIWQIRTMLSLSAR
jgi:hypothetical protein